ncbi:MAG TPA: DUF4124 domain-containing protein, partial [Chitinolyticbacter sp.]|nr:DUF4124 domain-containing protein [Chitinolyticbacter sp.]
MKPVISISLATIVVLAAAPLAAKVYQWRDANGNVYYSDQPPPGQTARERTIKPNVVNNGSPGKTVAPAAKLVLYSARGCVPCDEAQALLDSNQLPYDLQYPAEDPKRLNDFITKLGPGVSVQPPILEIDGQ